MTITQILASFAHDKQVAAVALLVAADFILGVLASLRDGTFRLTYVANFLHNDGAKVVAWFVVFAAGKASGDAGIVGPIDWTQASLVIFLGLTVSMGGSIMSSLSDLGVGTGLPQAINGHAPGIGVLNVKRAKTDAPHRP